MITGLEFLDGVGSESIAPNIEAYDGHVPSVSDRVCLDRNGNWELFRVVDRAFYFFGSRY